MTIYLHLSEDAVLGHAPLAQCGNTRTRHPLGAIERWIHETGTDATVTIKPFTSAPATADPPDQ